MSEAMPWTSAGPAAERLAVHRDDVELRGRTGFDPRFLAPGPLLPVPLPVPGPHAPPVVVLPYTHFTVVLRPDRRLAVATVAAVDGARLRDVDRAGSQWWLDPRVPQEQQTGPEVYARNDLDRGHLVRRRDPVWGTPEEAAQANSDTFCYTNAAPQHAGFNQSEELWLGLEDHVLQYAQTYDQRLAVVTGPVFADDDPVYRGVALPRRFYKVVAHLRAGRTVELAASAFLLDQSAMVERFGARAERAGRVPDLEPYRTFQVPVRDVALLTGLDLGPLPAADRLPAVAARAAGVPAGWRRVSAPDDVVW
ncbi:endonuclease G [Kineococcus xinjiangensis]|uniref:Endonuclease G n=1 Tax=Kineococcus xinjiangensis TaxID=512762 RepID=A0A2S6ITQ4_9ACTN|nr:DNA/RNA non-specific endonuclease [Kineococcus xinjiangensis]PPK97436.1 endonuclease G [Kineococcus xinjiangensis]